VLFAFAVSTTLTACTLHAAEPADVVIELLDGSRIRGKTTLDTVPIVTSYAEMTLPVPKIATVEYGEDRKTATVKFRNGDTVVGSVDLGALKIATLCGDLTLGGDSVQAIGMDTTGGIGRAKLKELPAAGKPANAARLALTLVDGSCIQTYCSNETIRVKTSYAEMDLKLDQLQVIAPTGKKDGMLARFINGDKLHCRLAVAEFRAASMAGELLVKAEHIRSLGVMGTGELPAELTRGLVAHYPFDGNAADAWTNGYHCTVRGAELARDRLGVEKSCYRIAGMNAVSMDHRAFNGLDEFSLSAWVCYDKVNQGQPWDANTIISIATDATREEFYFAQGLNGADLGLNIRGRNHGWHRFGRCRMEQGRWFHVVLTRKSREARLFMDGRFRENTRISAGALVTQKNGVVLGQHQHSVGGSFSVRQALTGRIDEVMLYRRALRDTEVKELYGFQKEK